MKIPDHNKEVFEYVEKQNEKYGDDNAFPQVSIDDMNTLIDLCDLHDVAKPAIFPCLKNGLEAKWETNERCLEIDDEQGFFRNWHNISVRYSFKEETLYQEVFEDIGVAFSVAEVFIKFVMKQKYLRDEVS